MGLIYSRRLSVAVVWSTILALFLGRQLVGVHLAVGQDTAVDVADIIGFSDEGFETSRDANRNKESSSVISWNGVEKLDTFINRFWFGNYFCEAMNDRNETHIRPTLLRITFGCEELFRTSGCGTGNFISAFYGLRLAARTLQDVDVVLECPDAVQEQTNLILPWLMGSFHGGASQLVSDQATFSNETTSKLHVKPPTKQEACGNFDRCSIGHMLPIIRFELRRMAVALVGVPHPKHPSATFAERYLWNDSNDSSFRTNTMKLQVPARGEPSLIPNVELDDVVVHFRCGDLMASSHPGFGFMKFSAFSKRISPEANSIGIVTQPFKKGGHQNREKDTTSSKQERCRVVVMELVNFLAQRFPATRIRVHNGPNETIALAYARMIMANQTMAGITTFGVFPVVAAFGTGYIRKPNFSRAPSQWLVKQPPLERVTDNIVLMKEPNRLMAGKVRSMWEQENGQGAVLEWFKNDTICLQKYCKKK